MALITDLDLSVRAHKVTVLILIADVPKKILVECMTKYNYTRDSKKTEVTFIANEDA